uniref:Uncharacterized protein n=1 Tax=Cannabis sativa TaxID=3483 RepID=A0A803QHI2_CANSA
MGVAGLIWAGGAREPCLFFVLVQSQRSQQMGFMASGCRSRWLRVSAFQVGTTPVEPFVLAVGTIPFVVPRSCHILARTYWPDQKGTTRRANQRLVFRVDNYSRKNSYVKGGLVLMDGTGKPLLTLKPQVFSIQYQWNAYKGSEESSPTKSSKVFSMRSKSSLLFTNMDKNAEAEVFFERRDDDQDQDQDQKNSQQNPDFRIEGCFWRRNCKIRNRNGEVVAHIARKKVNDRVLLGDDVFSLVVQPGVDAKLIMSFHSMHPLATKQYSIPISSSLPSTYGKDG